MSDVLIFFCERTGDRLYHRGYHCKDCGHRMVEHSTAEEYEASNFDGPQRACDQCGQMLRISSLGTKEAFRRQDTGEIVYDLPPGAVYEHQGYDWTEPRRHNWRQSPRPDGTQYFIDRPNEQDARVLACVCPDGHHWIIDARASNCTMPNDDDHWCWVRHGRPEDRTLHVDKSGKTCAAGAGSIATGKWHGFLHNGKLTQC